MLQLEQDPPVYYSIVILTILYYLRVADLMGITSPYPRENIIAGNYILADTQAFLSKRHRCKFRLIWPRIPLRADQSFRM